MHYQNFSARVFNFLKDLIPAVVNQHNRRFRHLWDDNNRTINIYYETLDSFKLGSNRYYQLMPKKYKKLGLGYENRLITLDTNLIILKGICNTYFPYDFEIVDSIEDSHIIVSNPYTKTGKVRDYTYYQVIFNYGNVEYLYYLVEVSHKNWYDDCLTARIVEEGHIMY